jgi:dTDP-4-dehydrorhamnose reductase
VTVLVTGSRGLLGTEVVSELSRRGHEPLALSHVELDVSDPEAAARLAAGEFGRPKWIINCAAYTAVDRAEQEEQLATEINGFGVGYLGHAIGQLSCSLLHVSTDFVFDGAKTSPYSESDSVNPLGAYGRSKLIGERALEGNPRAFVVRTSWLYGPNRNCFPKTMLNAFRQGKNLRVVSDQLGTPTYTPHLARTLVDIIERNPFPGVYHAAGPDIMSWHEFASRVIQKCSGSDGNVTPITTEDWPTPAKRPPYSALDSGKLQAEGIAPMPSVEAAIEDFCLKISS